MIRPTLTVLFLLTLVSLANAGEPQLYLSWNAPFGAPRATDSISPPCDSTGVDTLYLSFDPGRDASALLGLSASLYLRAPEGDSLGAYWRIEDMGRRESPLRVTFDADSARGFLTPWRMQGMGGPHYDYVQGSGRVRLIYAVPGDNAPDVTAGHVYGFARLLVRRPLGATQGGCRQAICVEWHLASIAFGSGDEVDANHGPRWVSINSPDGQVCRAFRGTIESKGWKPKDAHAH